MESKKSIAKILNKRRNALRMSRSELARRIGVCESTIRNWEKGYTSIPDDKKKIIAANLGLNIRELYYVPEDSDSIDTNPLDVIADYLMQKLNDFKKNEKLNDGNREEI